jgi:hypothetical protein
VVGVDVAVVEEGLELRGVLGGAALLDDGSSSVHRGTAYMAVPPCTIRVPVGLGLPRRPGPVSGGQLVDEVLVAAARSQGLARNREEPVTEYTSIFPFGGSSLHPPSRTALDDDVDPGARWRDVGVAFLGRGEDLCAHA